MLQTHTPKRSHNHQTPKEVQKILLQDYGWHIVVTPIKENHTKMLKDRLLLKLKKVFKQAIFDIEKDFESGKLIERLICGDTGFGKTEVAKVQIIFTEDAIRKG